MLHIEVIQNKENRPCNEQYLAIIKGILRLLNFLGWKKGDGEHGSWNDNAKAKNS